MVQPQSYTIEPPNPVVNEVSTVIAEPLLHRMFIVGKVNAPVVAKLAEVNPCGKNVCVCELLFSSVYVTCSLITSIVIAVMVMYPLTRNVPSEDGVKAATLDAAADNPVESAPATITGPILSGLTAFHFVALELYRGT